MPNHRIAVVAGLTALAVSALGLAATSAQAQTASGFSRGPTLVLPSDGAAAGLNGARGVVVNRAGTLAYVATPDGGLRKIALGRYGQRTIGFTRNVAGTDIALSADEKTAYVIDYHQSGIEVADVSGNTPRLLRTLSTSSLEPNAIAASRNGKFVAWSGGAGWIQNGAYLLSTARSRIPVAIKGQHRIDGQILSLAFTPDSQSLVLGREDSAISTYSLSRHRITSTVATRDEIDELAVTADGRYAYGTGADAIVNKIDLNRHRRVALSAEYDWGESISVSPDARYVYLLTRNGLDVLSAATLRGVRGFGAFYPSSVATSTAGATRGMSYVFTEDQGQFTPPTLETIRQSAIGPNPTALRVSVGSSPKHGKVKKRHKIVLTAHPSGGSHRYAYTWYRNGKALPGKHSYRLVIRKASKSKAGTYTVRVIDSSGWLLTASEKVKIKK